jgi:hypothetical protein
MQVLRQLQGINISVGDDAATDPIDQHLQGLICVRSLNIKYKYQASVPFSWISTT